MKKFLLLTIFGLTMIGCNNDNEPILPELDPINTDLLTNGTSEPVLTGMTISIKNSSGIDLLNNLETSTVSIKMPFPYKEEERSVLALDKFKAKIYLDGMLVKTDYKNYLFDFEEYDGCRNINLSAYDVSTRISRYIWKELTDEGKLNEHIIEYHLVYPELFQDDEEHIILLKYIPIHPYTDAFNHHYQISLDGREFDVYYDEKSGRKPSNELGNRYKAYSELIYYTKYDLNTHP